MKNLIHIDGSQGEGGGQILRTSLTMSMVTGTPVQIDNIRSGRNKPGLMRQHLACVRAAQAVSDAEVSGAKVGSTAITFKPKGIKAGDYRFAVGTAGSTTLIFQTVLPALVMADAESTITFVGGTHNMWAPSFDYIALAYLPLLKQMGIDVDVKLEKHGFYPQGCGQWSAVIKPAARIHYLEVLEPGELTDREAMITSANIPVHVAEREMQEIAKRCSWPEASLKMQRVDAMGGGNIVSLRLHYERCSEVIESVGRVGVSAEKVANSAVKSLHRYLAAAVPVGEHLADQLLVPMAIGEGGLFRTVRPSRHTLTNRDVIHHFTDKYFKFTELAKDRWEIR